MTSNIEEQKNLTAEKDSECCHDKKKRSPKEFKNLMNRLKRIEGQIRGLQGMLERDAYCPEILIQAQAVNAAMNSFNKLLLTNHLKTCVLDDIRKGNDQVVDELVHVMHKLMK